MSVREQQVNDALRVLDEMHRLCRIERDDYRQRRRRLLESLSDADFQRRFVHPESGPWRLDQYLSQYAWHGRHHIAHITELRSRMSWS